MRVMLPSSQIGYQKSTLRNHTSREKLKKGTRHQRTERHCIKGVVAKVKPQVCYVRITEITNKREDIEVQQEIRAPYNCVIKIIFYYYFNIFNNLYRYYFLLGSTWGNAAR